MTKHALIINDIVRCPYCRAELGPLVRGRLEFGPFRLLAKSATFVCKNKDCDKIFTFHTRLETLTPRSA